MRSSLSLTHPRRSALFSPPPRSCRWVAVKTTTTTLLLFPLLLLLLLFPVVVARPTSTAAYVPNPPTSLAAASGRRMHVVGTSDATYPAFLLPSSSSSMSSRGRHHSRSTATATATATSSRSGKQRPTLSWLRLGGSAGDDDVSAEATTTAPARIVGAADAVEGPRDDGGGSSSSASASEFVNDGPLRWMEPYLDTLGIQEGKTLAYGPLAVELRDDENRPSPAEADQLRKRAAQDLVNIDPKERHRRNQAGTVLTYLTILYAFWASVLADDGGLGGHALRFLVAIPLFLALGYKRSAQLGLCNIAQKGLWDVDGNGLRKIDDPDVASTILRRVNDMNLNTFTQAALAGAAFAALPKASSSALATLAALGAVLYAARNVVLEVDGPQAPPSTMTATTTLSGE